MTESEFTASEVFDADYLYFYEPELSAQRNDREAVLVERLLHIDRGTRVLDLACGHGRLANRIAERGAHVTGVDTAEEFLDLARGDAAERGVTTAYVRGDMRSLPFQQGFDAVLSWFTSFGYFSDEENRRVLDEVARVLRPGGRFALELMNPLGMMGAFSTSVVRERDGDLLVDRPRLDPLTQQIRTERTVVRDGRARRTAFTVRLLGFPELRDWLTGAGFREVHGCGPDGAALTEHHARMVVVAVR